MSDAPQPTFRDFASSIFAGDLDAAARTLTLLLGLSPEEARTAAEHFRAQTADPAFLPKAMSLRTAIESRDDALVAGLLTDCFGLASAEAQAATTALRARYA